MSATLEPPPGATRTERLALRLVQLGVLAVVPAVATFYAFELDRFFVPKELALHVTAFLSGLLALRAIARSSFTRVDLLLVAYLVVSFVSSAIATNSWLAMRAVAISASGLVVFWASRALRNAGLARPLVGTLALSVVLIAMTSLLQTYGVETMLFSENRAPGGTLGNRNFVAHAGACGLPLLLLVALRAQRFAGLLMGAVGIAIVTASLVLTRSRAAWLAFAAVTIVFIAGVMLSSSVRREWQTWRRLTLIVLFVAGGVAAAIMIPNTLRWRSDDPYLDTVKRVADYQQGSGRGRLVQYTRSLVMALRNPVLGVGAGNWSVEYPSYAVPRDPSLDEAKPGMTFNPWPSSDWIAIVAERGFLAAASMGLAILAIALGGLKQIVQAQQREHGLVGCSLLGTVTGAAVTGMFDAVLLLGLPTLLFWAAAGALWEPTSSRLLSLPRTVRYLFTLLLLAFTGIGAARSGAQLVAMQIYETRSDGASLQNAARIDPGNYRLRLRLARTGTRKERCAHARAAHALFPSAQAAAQASRSCR